MPVLTVRPTFTLFGIPVYIASSFWIMTILFGGMRGDVTAVDALAGVVSWTAVVFVSILLHELGHALSARRYGMTPTITLHAMGGLTHFEGGRLSRWQTGLVSFAGPAMGLVIGGVVYLLVSGRPLSPRAHDLVYDILWVNVGWSLINLCPVLPFDGGHILAAAMGPRRAFATAVVSALVGAAIGAIAFLSRQALIGVLFGSATFGAVRQARQLWLNRRETQDGAGAEIAKIREAMERGSSGEVRGLAESLLENARTSVTKNAGLLALAWSHATEGRTAAARDLVEKLARDVPPEPYLFAALEDALGEPERARAWLEAVRQQGWRRPDTIKLLIDLYARAGQIARATEVAGEELETLGRDDARSVLSAAMGENAYRAAARLAARIFERWSNAADGLDEARAWALGGDAAQALALLERLVGNGGGHHAAFEREALRRDAAFASLHGQARFERLLEGPASPTAG